MRLAVLSFLAVAGLAIGGPPVAAKPHGPARPADAIEPPHAWLFGAWTGGIFPVLDGMAEQDCRTQPTVVFGRDIVGYASLLGAGLTQRNIATVRATRTGAEFTFVPETTATPGFGCPNTDELIVTRNGLNEIDFPNCAAFPYPLERCAG